jgi:hypothetical protein
MLDLAGSDSLTADWDGVSASKLGTQAAASGPLGTVLEATEGLTIGRVGVLMSPTVRDDGLGEYELGEVGGGIVAPVVVENALVLVDATSVAGAAVQVGASAGTACFAVGAGATYGILLEDCTIDDGKGPTAALNYRHVLLYSDGIAAVADALANGFPVAARYVEDEYYALLSQPSATALDTLALTADQSTLYKWNCQLSVTPQALGVYLTVGVDTSTTAILVYAHDLATGGPGALIFASAAFDTEIADASAFAGAVAGLPSFVAGTSYWLGVLSDDAITVRSQTAAAPSLLGHLAAVGDTTPATHLVLAAEVIATPTDPWVYDVAQHAVGECAVVIMQA